MAKIRKFIEGNFSLLLLVGVILGFFVPKFGAFADELVIFLTAVLIFLSCAEIKPVDFLKMDIFQIGIFVVLRFAVFPLMLFFLAYQFIPEYAVGVLLLSLMPAGVAVASLCSMSHAKVVLGLGLTIISSLLAPAIIPAAFSFLGKFVEVDIFDLFLVLSGVVFLPIGLYFGLFNRSEQMSGVIRKYNKAGSVLILSFILVIVIAAQKEALLNDISTIVYGMIIMTVLFISVYAFGFIYALFVPKDDRVAYILSSGAMNNSLAVGLAFAYFDPKISIFIVLSEIVWSFCVAVAQWYFSKRSIVETTSA